MFELSWQFHMYLLSSFDFYFWICFWAPRVILSRLADLEIADARLFGRSHWTRWAKRWCRCGSHIISECYQLRNLVRCSQAKGFIASQTENGESDACGTRGSMIMMTTTTTMMTFLQTPRSITVTSQELLWIFTILSAFLQAFGFVWTCSHMFGCIRMYSDAFATWMGLNGLRHIRTLSEKRIEGSGHFFFILVNLLRCQEMTVKCSYKVQSWSNAALFTLRARNQLHQPRFLLVHFFHSSRSLAIKVFICMSNTMFGCSSNFLDIQTFFWTSKELCTVLALPGQGCRVLAFLIPMEPFVNNVNE